MTKLDFAATSEGSIRAHEFSATLWIVGACAFTSMASMRICDAMLPALASDFETTSGQAATTISAFALAYGCLQLFFGPLGDRYGKVRVIGCATVACTFGNALAVMSPSLDWLVASRAVSGAAAAGIVPLTMAWIGDSVAYEERQAVLAQLLGATVFGMVSGQWLGGLFADTLGWRSAFVLLTAAFAGSGALILLRPSGEIPSRQGSGGLVQRVRHVVALPWARTVLVVTAIEGALAFSALAFIPSHLHTSFGLSMPHAGALVFLYAIGGLLYTCCARALLRRMGEHGLAKFGAMTTAVAFTAMAWAPSWTWIMPACLVAGFGFYALHNTLQTHATQMAPEIRGTAVALFACSLFFGQSLGVLVAAWIVDHYSTPPVFATSAIGLLILGCTFSILVQRRGPDDTLALAPLSSSTERNFP